MVGIPVDASRRRVFLVPDLPASADAFGGSHDRVARALDEMIAAEPGGHTVGIEGVWGSGKSTVVKLLETRLEEDPDRALFVFDAWAHQGDPLRRSFLESLIQFLAGEVWLGEDKATAMRERLAKRRSVSVRRTSQSLTPFGRVLAASAALVPMGVALLAFGLAKGGRAYELGIGIALAVAPACLAALAFLAALKKSEPLNIESELASLDVHVDETKQGFFSVFSGDTVVRERTNNSDDPDPTSVEFAEYFNTIASAALVKKNRRLVLVLDNLDRIEPADSLAVLATLQTFVGTSEHSSPEWFHQLWVLIPYDPQGLARLWNRSGGEEVAREFMDKLFQVRFLAPPLALSDWRQYFLDTLKIAFPDDPFEERELVYRVASAYRADTWQFDSPRPRQLIRLTNQIGSMRRQWPEYTLGELAYFADLSLSGASVVRDVRGRQLPTPLVASLLGKDRAKDVLQSLAFNVPIERARHLTILEPLRDALLEGKADVVNGLRGPGFWDVFETLPVHEWADRGANQLGLASNTVNEIDLSEDPDGQARAHRVLAEAMTAAESIRPDTATAGRGLGLLIDNRVRSESDARNLLARASSPDEEELNEQQARTRIAGISELVRATLSQIDLTVPLDVSIVVGAERDVFINLLGQSPPDDQDVWQFLVPPGSPQEFGTTMGARIQAAAADIDLATAVDYLLARPERADWSIVGQEARAWLESQDSPPRPAAGHVVRILVALHTTVGDSNLNAVVDGGRVHSLFQEAAEASDDSTCAACVLSLCVLGRTTMDPPPFNRSPEGHGNIRDVLVHPQNRPGVVQSTLELARTMHLTEQLMSLAEQDPEAVPFANCAMKESLRRPGDVTPPSGLATIEKWHEIREASGEPITQVPTGVAVEIVQELDARSFDEGLVDLAVLAIRATEATADTEDSSETATRWILSGLGAVTQDRWRTSLDTQDHLVDAVVALLERNRAIDLSNPFEQAFIEHGAALAAGEVVLTRLIAEWSRLPDALQADHMRKAIPDRLITRLAGLDGSIAEGFFNALGGMMKDAAEVREYPRLLPDVLEPIVRTDRGAGMAWVSGLLRDHPDVLVAEVHKDHRAHLVSVVDNVVHEQRNAGEMTTDLAELARTLGLDPD